MLKLLAKALGVAAVVLLLGFIAANTIFVLPDRQGIVDSNALEAPDRGRLASMIQAMSQAHPERTGVALLSDGASAFAARALLTEVAERSIDAQYYIWHGDLTGMLLLDALRKAAERGVRVRLLLDDNGISGLDPLLAALADHPHIDIRLFNPFVLRRPKFLNFAFDFLRLNRRMHNKSFTVDNSVTVMGGRNIADEYFGAGPNPLYIDLDVLAAGAIVPAVSADFDSYWNSASAYPVDVIIGRITEPAPPETTIDTALDRLSTQPHAEAYFDVLRAQDTVRLLMSGELPLEWVPVRLVSDHPGKVLGESPRDELLFSQLVSALGEPRSRLDLVSPYFVPGARGTADLTAMARRGVDVNIFTNSLEATDVAAVHAGYAKYRKPLLASGIALFELKPGVAASTLRQDIGLAGSSSTSLHAKLIAIDGDKLFVGSFNFDPRSVSLNTEMGLVIDSSALARRVHDRLSESALLNAYRPHLRGDTLVWYECRQGREVAHIDEPGAGLFKRLTVTVVSWLPVQWLL